MGAGAGICLALIAWGAVLAFGVNFSPSGFDLDLIGWILMGLGVAGAIICALVATSRGPAGTDEADTRR